MTRRLRHFVRPSIDARSLIVPIALLGAGLAACTSSSTDAATPTTEPPTTSTPAPTSAPATTAPPSTTTAAAPKWTDEELAIIQAHDRFQITLVAALTDDGFDLSQLSEVATASLASNLRMNIEGRRDAGIESQGTMELAPLGVSLLSPTVATVRACIWDKTERFEGGIVTVAADESPFVRESRLTYVDGEWLADGLVSDESDLTPCEL